MAVVCLTGISGTSPHSTTPAMPAMTAISRATRWAGTRLDGRRRTYRLRDGGDRHPRRSAFRTPLSSAGYRMLEVTIGAGISVLTTLMLFPSRAGPAFAEHVERTLPMLF